MIRDPSDGTVRDGFPVISPEENGARRGQNVLDNAMSGLPTDKLKADEIERLEKSRGWLRNYFNQRAAQTGSGLRSPDSGEG